MSSANLHPSRRALAIALMIASGFAGLGYQIVWTQQGALWLGHEAPAVLAVVTAFFGGLAVGAYTLSARIERSEHPARWYAGCEVVIGLWSLALVFLLQPTTGIVLDLVGTQPSALRHWAVSFGGTFLVLLPATMAMGATLPAMEKVLTKGLIAHHHIALLYAANTLGAVIGVLVTAFLLIPAFGMSRTVFVCAGLNFLCAGAVQSFFPASRDSDVIVEPAQSTHAPALLVIASATGLLGIGYEVLVVRVLSQIAENTVYSFALTLAVYLAGTALGAASYYRWAGTAHRTTRTRGDCLTLALALTCLLGLLFLSKAAAFKKWLIDALGSGFAAAIGAEALLAVAAFLVPTMVMGALFSHLATRARTQGISFGQLLSLNTGFASLAPLVFGLWLVPALGPTKSLLLVATGYLLLVSRHAWRTPLLWTVGAAIALVAWSAPSLIIVDVPQGGRIAQYTEGVQAAVSVVEDARGVATLHINNRQQEGSSATRFTDARQALLPLLLHPAPRRALFLGLGTGVTAWSAAQDRHLKVEAVELLPEVAAASGYFSRPIAEENPISRPEILIADARRFVHTTSAHYDLIVADNFHPARSGSGALYTTKHFAAVRHRLNEGGLFCQWLPLHQMDLKTLRVIVRSFLTAFPKGWAMLATNSLETPVVGLVGRRGDAGFDPDGLRQRLDAAGMPRSPAQFGIEDDLALLGSFFAGPGALSRFARDAPLNTDDHPVVVYLAPRITYAADSLPRDRLLALLHEVNISPGELLVPRSDEGVAPRLAAYWTARDRFIEAGRNVRPDPDVRRMLAQVHQPLLEVLRVSPDFRPAYDPLLMMARALADTDAQSAKFILKEIHGAQPARPEAMRALMEMSAESSTQ